MQCRECEYPLWTIRARQCPECGAEFKPSDFEFVPNTVRFLCPHCSQAYYGNTHEGHLHPRTFSCIGCGEHIDMDEMILDPVAGVEERFIMNPDTHIPWVNRKQNGFFRGWLRTIGWALGRPHRLGELIPAHGGVWASVCFAILTNTLYLLVGAAPLFIFAAMLSFAAMGGRGGGRGVGMIFGLLIGFVGPMLAIIAIQLLVIALVGLTAHALLTITGPTRRTLGTTMQAAMYCSAANILLAIPCLSFYASAVSWVWVSVALTITLMYAHDVRWWRSTIASFALHTFLFLCFAAFIGWWMVAGVAQARTAVTAAQTQALQMEAQADLMQLGPAISAFEKSRGRWPDHAIELIGDGLVGIDAYVATAGPTYTMTINGQVVDDPSASPTADEIAIPAEYALADFEYATEEQLAFMIEDVRAAMPEGVIAHRVGEIVFTYHGVPRLHSFRHWIAVRLQANQKGTPVYDVLYGDGSTQMILGQDWEAELAAENSRRAAAGLPPLPDVEDVGDDPWTGE